MGSKGGIIYNIMIMMMIVVHHYDLSYICIYIYNIYIYIFGIWDMDETLGTFNFLARSTMLGRSTAVLDSPVLIGRGNSQLLCVPLCSQQEIIPNNDK